MHRDNDTASENRDAQIESHKTRMLTPTRVVAFCVVMAILVFGYRMGERRGWWEGGGGKTKSVALGVPRAMRGLLPSEQKELDAGERRIEEAYTLRRYAGRETDLVKKMRLYDAILAKGSGRDDARMQPVVALALKAETTGDNAPLNVLFDKRIAAAQPGLARGTVLLNKAEYLSDSAGKMVIYNAIIAGHGGDDSRAAIELVNSARLGMAELVDGAAEKIRLCDAILATFDPDEGYVMDLTAVKATVLKASLTTDNAKKKKLLDSVWKNTTFFSREYSSFIANMLMETAKATDGIEEKKTIFAQVADQALQGSFPYTRPAIDACVERIRLLPE